MVLDHGRIIERGTHEDLIKLKGHLLSAVYRRFGAGLIREKHRKSNYKRTGPPGSNAERPCSLAYETGPSQSPDRFHP